MVAKVSGVFGGHENTPVQCTGRHDVGRLTRVRRTGSHVNGHTWALTIVVHERASQDSVADGGCLARVPRRRALPGLHSSCILCARPPRTRAISISGGWITRVDGGVHGQGTHCVGCIVMYTPAARVDTIVDSAFVAIVAR